MFELERIEVDDFQKGRNEAVFSINDVKFHVPDNLDLFEVNPSDPEHSNSIGFKVIVPDIERTYQKALDKGGSEIRPIKKMEEFGISNAIFKDQFGYLWILHKIYKEVGFEERVEIFEDKMNG